jgi:mRNA interferase RelE/StbE
MYQLFYEKKAIGELAALDPVMQRRIKEKLAQLCQDPESLRPQIKRLKGKEFTGLERLRVGSYRVIFRREEDRLIVLVLRIGHRKEIY